MRKLTASRAINCELNHLDAHSPPFQLFPFYHLNESGSKTNTTINFVSIDLISVQSILLEHFFVGLYGFDSCAKVERNTASEGRTSDTKCMGPCRLWSWNNDSWMCKNLLGLVRVPFIPISCFSIVSRAFSVLFYLFEPLVLVPHTINTNSHTRGSIITK